MRHVLDRALLAALLGLAPWVVLGGEGPAATDLGGQIAAAEEELKKDEKDLFELKDVFTKKKKEAEKPLPPAVEARVAEEWDFARRTHEFAQQALERAKAAVAPNPTLAQVELKDALDKARLARDCVRRAESAFRPPPAATAGQPPGPRGAWGFSSRAWEQLVAISGNPAGYDGSRHPAAQGVDARNYDPTSRVLTTRSGTRVPVGPFDDALQRVLPERSRRLNLFVPVPTPDGAQGVQLNRGIVKALSSPQAQAELQKVGGVALDVTLDLLSYAGVADFRRRGPATVVESPVLLSLAGLYEKVRPLAAAGESLEGLPSDLRYPGAIERLHGFVLDPESQDVFLVGSRAQAPEHRIDIDCLILGLRSVWAEGSIPSVSLDPLPGRPAGPQYSRVYAVPFDSTPAKIMLDADYAMKRITIGEQDVGVPRFAELAKARATQAGYHGSRYWLTPMPVGAGEIHISPTYRSLLFDSGVRTLTEAHDAAGEYTGEPNEVSEQAARLFTESYEGFERLRVIEPQGIFLRLHGLVDVVTACKILRDLGVAYPVLEKFSKLPARHLVGSDAVPGHYPGITVKHAEDQKAKHYLVGGAVLRARATRRSLDLYQDATTASLERAVDAFPRGQGFATTVELSFTVPRAATDNRAKVDYAMLAGHAALKAKRLEQARDRFKEVIQEDPYYADAWACLGGALSLLGDHEEAAKAMLKAVELEPNDLMEMEADVARRAGKALDPAQHEAWKRRCLSEQYALLASDLMGHGDPKHGKEMADFAIQLWDENPDAHFARSECSDDPRSDEAVRDRARAIELYRKLLKGEHGEKWRRALAFALSQDVGPRIGLLERKAREAADPRGNLTPGEAMEAVLKDLEAIIGEAAEARKLDESLGLTWAVEAEARAFKAKLFLTLGLQPDLVTPRTIALQATKKFPDLPDAHFALAFVATIQGIAMVRTPEGRRLLPTLNLREETFRELAKAIELDPTYCVAYLFRAPLLAASGQREKALEDLRKAKELDPNLDPAMEEMIRRAIGPQQPGKPAGGAESSVFQVRLVAQAPAEDADRMTLVQPSRDPGQTQEEVLHVKKEVLLDGSAVKSASVKAGGSFGPTIVIDFTDDGRKRFAEITRQNIGKRLALIIDGRVCSAPVFRSEISGGAAHVWGLFSEQEAKDLAAKINKALVRDDSSIRETIEHDSAAVAREEREKRVVSNMVLWAKYLKQLRTDKDLSEIRREATLAQIALWATESEMLIRRLRPDLAVPPGPTHAQLYEYVQSLIRKHSPDKEAEFREEADRILQAKLPGSWPRFRGQRLDNISRDDVPLARSWPAGGPKVLWSLALGEGHAGAAVRNGRVYVLDYDQKPQADALRCLSLADGKEVWRFAYPVEVKPNHGMSRTVPTVTEKHVITFGPKCHVACLDVATGKPRWPILDLVKEHGTTVPPWYAGQCPLVDGDRLILAPGGPDALLLAIELETGKVVWKTPNPDRWEMTHASVVPMDYKDRHMLVYAASGGVVGVNAEDGKVLWKTAEWKISIATVPSPVVFEDGRVFLTGGHNAGSAMLQLKEQGEGFAAEPLFRLPPKVFDSPLHTPILHEGSLYAVRSDGQLACADLRGKVLWDSGSGHLFGLGPYLVANGLLFVMSDKGVLTLAEATPVGYKPLAQAQVFEDGHDAWGPMAIAGGRLIVRDFTRMACLDVKQP
jgi:outer membrane protein assembly factor BamB